MLNRYLPGRIPQTTVVSNPGMPADSRRYTGEALPRRHDPLPAYQGAERLAIWRAAGELGSRWDIGSRVHNNIVPDAILKCFLACGANPGGVP